jgi:hypothetical protein
LFSQLDIGLDRFFVDSAAMEKRIRRWFLRANNCR